MNNTRLQRMGVRRQAGVIVFVALVALLLLSLAALALLRTSDTAGVIAGNLAFKKAATGAADTGAERAFNELPTLAAGDVDVPGKYYRLIQVTDASGVPMVDWSTVPCYDTAGTPAAIACDDGGSYRVQYVIERLCTEAPIPTDALAQLITKCVAGAPFSTAGGAGSDTDSHAQTTNVFGGGPPVAVNRPTVHYRVTVRVRGPRNTSSLVQTTVELPFG